MNIYFIVIIAILVGAWLLNLAAGLLNLRAMSAPLPEEFREVVDDAAYRRSQAYARANLGLGAVSETFFTWLAVAFIWAGGFDALDGAVRSLGLSPVPTGLVYIAALLLALDLLNLPFSLYRNFVIEERFGFNSMGFGTFAKDKLKGWALAAAIGGPLIALILFFFRAAGPWAWLWCWLAASAVMVGLTYVAPIWILPLFNTFTPLERGELRDALESLVERNGFAPDGVFVMDGSKRSTKANAFFTGLGKKKRIALYDTLLERHSTAEVEAVSAHEIGHSVLGHVKKNLLMALARTGLMFWLLSFFIASPKLASAFGMEHVSVYAGLVFFGLLFTPVSLALAVAANWVSRRHERQADGFAARTSDPLALALALKKMAAHGLSNLTPHPLVVALEYSHPPVVERVRTLEGTAPTRSKPA